MVEKHLYEIILASVEDVHDKSTGMVAHQHKLEGAELVTVLSVWKVVKHARVFTNAPKAFGEKILIFQNTPSPDRIA